LQRACRIHKDIAMVVPAVRLTALKWELDCFAALFIKAILDDFRVILLS
jgi:hypothetical protein